ncbi:MAG: hypothetical protein F6K54_13940 [Okeania sp. SIO3B5]|uniref:hypothetical protein n=1 Tax=Okeania sp. SIO3B5 TaxID=2607811 RepID=UPI0013FF9669|nr:hypothetical protein [Okeania sp. SIO3B5]NEO54083.1 hypothetical protein [Okeania sp. SIO3B5]
MSSPKMTNDMKNLSFSQIKMYYYYRDLMLKKQIMTSSQYGLYLGLALLYDNFLITTIGDLAPNITRIFDHKLSAKVSTDNDIMVF